MKSIFLLLISCVLLYSTCETPKIIPSKKTSPRPKNIILMIGDGMGVSQITAGLFSNNNTLFLEQFPIVGLHKPYSADNLITDSAAGATAFACGQKSYNGAISVDINKKPLKTILEVAEENGLKTGLVATSTIVHATPACFISHVEERHMYEDIALDFLKIDIDFFAGGGLIFFNQRKDGKDLIQQLTKQGYTIQNSSQIKDFRAIRPNIYEKYGLFTAVESPKKASEGRSYLPEVSLKAVNFLDSKDIKNKGFFIMIEGSQIDWGGHDNDGDYVISEMKDFNKTIGKILEFAKKDGETLVIVTADHETGGLAINPDSKMGKLKTVFTTEHHTADIIPVFAYGPGSESFSGIYENTGIYDKMMKAFGFLPKSN